MIVLESSILIFASSVDCVDSGCEILLHSHSLSRSSKQVCMLSFLSSCHSHLFGGLNLWAVEAIEVQIQVLGEGIRSVLNNSFPAKFVMYPDAR